MIIPSYQSPAFVLASIAIAVLTAYVAITTSDRIREHEGDERWVWVGLSSLCLGGGIWSMHFIAMLGYVLPIDVGYNISLTLLSWVLPIVVAALGFHIASNMSELTWPRAAVIGVIYGSAIVIMHYTGMAAMRMEATIDWNVAYVVASIAVAIVASTAAIKAAFHQLTFLPAVVGSLLMGLAISGMHYTAMCAVTVVSDASASEGEVAISLTRNELGVIVTAIAAIVLMAGMVAANWDRHRRSR